MEWEKTTIFVSSTFNDMHAERNYLIKEVFPELKEWAKKHYILLNYVDLRYLIEETDKNDVVRMCLKYIDNSRPFFICFIGQRIGWIPRYDTDINSKTKDKYPSIRELIDYKSVTEIEIEHALFSPLSERLNDKEIISHYPTKHNLFFFRTEDYLNELNEEQKKNYTNLNKENPEIYDKKLINLKSRIRKKAEQEDKMNLYRKDDEKIHISINEYSGQWDKNINLSELSNNGLSSGALTNFECNNRPLNEFIIEELKKQLILSFPDNK